MDSDQTVAEARTLAIVDEALRSTGVEARPTSYVGLRSSVAALPTVLGTEAHAALVAALGELSDPTVEGVARSLYWKVALRSVAECLGATWIAAADQVGDA